MTGLRERWRLDAMQTIQERALDLFDQRGFSAVTIEEIAAAAEVSASSVYRYFGTKEGLIVADEFDNMSQEMLEGILDPHDPVGSLHRIVVGYETAAESASPVDAAHRESQAVRSPWRRIRYFFTEPSVRMAVCAALDRAAQRIAPLLAANDNLSELQARVQANALTFGYFAVLEQWYLDGGDKPIATYVEDGMRSSQDVWSTNRAPSPRPRCDANGAVQP